MSEPLDFMRLDGERISVVWMQRGALLDCIYLGPRLTRGEDLQALALAIRHGRHENQPDAPPVGGLLPDPGTGWRGPTLVRLSLGSHSIQPNWTLSVFEQTDNCLLAGWEDGQFELQVRWQMTPGDIVAASTKVIANDGGEIGVDRLASLLLPLPRGFDHVTHFAGRWADDMRAERLPITRAGLCWASTGGKSAFAGGDYLVFDDERAGARIGIHFAHSGDHETRISCNEDGLATVVVEEPLDSHAEPVTTQEWTTPGALFTWAADDAALTHAFHSYARHRVQHFGGVEANGDGTNPPRDRKVHFNTWEACGFDFDEARLIDLADQAADLGAERFVIDDGWFKGRINDRAGLGDWTPNAERFPNGLNPLIDHTKSLGMDFGLWVEPEMVSPDSDLYRAHPDWCMHDQGAERPTERGQLVLDLSRSEVFEHIHAALDRLLSEHDIAYLKWDHNRRHFPRSGQSSSALADAFERLVKRLRAAHPDVMIESCSSGGGRIDFHTLGPCERFWPSDNNDAIERVRIMREWTRFLPLEVLGNHVGPSPNPITGRQVGMDFRAKIALFGHMGIEADPGAMSAQDRSLLAAHIELYKQSRDLLHSGRLYHLGHPDPAIFAQAVVGRDTALAVAAQTGFSALFNAAPIKLKGLDAEAAYRVRLPRPWPAKASLYLPDWQNWESGITLSGTALMSHGLALPLTHPETAWLIALERIPG